MNKRGFTLIELLATIVIIGIIMALVFPNALKIRKENDLKICKEYESMMEEYARVNLNKMEDYIDLIELEELDNVKNDCDGYVIVDHSVEPATYKSYVSCSNGCKTAGYNDKDSRMITIVIKASDITTTYLESIPSFSYNMTSSSDLAETNPLTSMVTYKVVDAKGDVVEVNSNTPAGEYTIIPSTTVKSKYRLVIQNGTLTINKIQCIAPTNVKVATNGIVTWTGSSNCPNSHQVRINDGEGETATSGVNKKSELISSPGNKMVYVKAISTNPNYSDSPDAKKSINVYKVTLTKGTEISSVTGAGNYISGETVTIKATQNSGKIWKNWIDTNTNAVISTDQTYSAVISSNWNYTAEAYNKQNNTVTITKKTCTYNGNSCAATASATNGTPTIKYYTNSSCSTGESSSAPINAGTYYAKATVAESANYFAGDSGCKEAVVINKATNTVSITKKTYTYDGSGKTATVTATNGTPTIKYYTNSSCSTGESSSAPINAGTYYAKATVAESANYFAGSSGCKEAVVITKANGYITLSSTSGTVTCYNSKTVTISSHHGGTLSCSSSSNTAKCTISSTTVILDGAKDGSATITVKSAATTNYNEATATYSATVKCWINSCKNYNHDCSHDCSPAVCEEWCGIKFGSSKVISATCGNPTGPNKTGNHPWNGYCWCQVKTKPSGYKCDTSSDTVSSCSSSGGGSSTPAPTSSSCGSTLECCCGSTNYYLSGGYCYSNGTPNLLWQECDGSNVWYVNGICYKSRKRSYC